MKLEQSITEAWHLRAVEYEKWRGADVKWGAKMADKTPADQAFVVGFVTGMHWLWSRGYVDTSDHVVEALREFRIFVEDMKEADLDARILDDIRGRGAPHRD